jgi:hypothetical protein
MNITNICSKVPEKHELHEDRSSGLMGFREVGAAPLRLMLTCEPSPDYVCAGFEFINRVVEMGTPPVEGQRVPLAKPDCHRFRAPCIRTCICIAVMVLLRYKPLHRWSKKLYTEGAGVRRPIANGDIKGFFNFQRILRALAHLVQRPAHVHDKRVT